MFASAHKHDFPLSALFRFCGRAGGVIVLALWALLVGIEFLRSGAPSGNNYVQAAFLGIVFLGYAIGWRRELLGGALTLVGTCGFIAFNQALMGAPLLGSIWFAAPGVFYLIAHYLDEPHNQQWSGQP